MIILPMILDLVCKSDVFLQLCNDPHTVVSFRCTRSRERSILLMLDVWGIQKKGMFTCESFASSAMFFFKLVSQNMEESSSLCCFSVRVREGGGGPVKFLFDICGLFKRVRQEKVHTGDKVQKAVVALLVS
ncbi:hypothetical protein VPH35_074993 [Triticum aestivum]